MRRISVIIGTRPEAIKMVPVIKALRTKGLDVSVCKTGQHTEMVDSVLEIFSIESDVSFDLPSTDRNLNNTVATILQKFENYFRVFQPDLVFIQGDTASAFAGAVAAFNMKIKVAHVEAGLRTGNLLSPWPEEGYRSMISPIADYHFAPTKLSAQNLQKSGVPNEKIFITGNTVIDALQMAEALIEKKETALNLSLNILESKSNKRILITAHRRENWGPGLNNLCKAVTRLAVRYTDIDFIIPVHLNPIVYKQVNSFFKDLPHKNVHLIEPQSYLEFVWLMKNSLFIISDSGGIQEEAPGLGKPVLVTRDTTERPEGIEAGTVKLVGTSEASLFNAACSLLDDEEAYKRMSQAQNPYGDGKAVERILQAIFER